MNEQDNTTLIQTVYAAFGRGDVQTILDHLAADVQWIADGPPVIPYAGTLAGPGEVVHFFEALAETQDGHKLTIDEYIAQGDQVATCGRYSARVKATGKHIDCAIAHIFTVQKGKIVRYHGFADTAQMADAYAPMAAAAR